VFSDTGNLITRKRNSLDPDTVDQFIFIKSMLRKQMLQLNIKTEGSQSSSGSVASNAIDVLPSLPILPDQESTEDSLQLPPLPPLKDII